VIDKQGNIIPNDDSARLNGYGGPKSYYADPAYNHGLVTFRKWTINNDPTTQDLRYDFVSAGVKDGANATPDDMRLLMATGPFTMPPGAYVETTIGMTLAQGVDAQTALTNLLLLTDFAHEVFATPDTSFTSHIIKDTAGNNITVHDTGYSFTHFLSPVPPDVPNLKTQALDRAVFLTWDSTAERSVDFISGLYNLPDSLHIKGYQGNDSLVIGNPARKLASQPFSGYQLWRTTRSDRDSTIRPDGNNPNVLLGQWQQYDYAIDSVFDSKGHLNHFHYRRTNDGKPHPIPHTYLDVGDDNHDGVVNGTEGLYNGVKYYYYLLAFDEYDSINQVGPLFTSVVAPKNLVSESPAKPPTLTTFSDNTSADVADPCTAGGSQPVLANVVPGGLKSVSLDIVDTGRFAQIFTGDIITVQFQPKWIGYNNHNLSPLQEQISVFDTRNGVNVSGKSAYLFPLTLPPLPGAIIGHVNGTLSPDSSYLAQFTSDNGNYAPNQLIDQTFRVLADIQFEQLSAPYELDSVRVSGGVDPDILRLTRRSARPIVWTGLDTTNVLVNGADTTNQAFSNIYHLRDTLPHYFVMPFYDTIVTNGGISTNHRRIRPYTVIHSDDKDAQEYYADSANSRVLAYLDIFRTSTIVYKDSLLLDTLPPGFSSDVDPTRGQDTTFLTAHVVQRDTIIVNATRTTFMGGLGDATYEVSFDPPVQVPIYATTVNTVRKDTIINGADTTITKYDTVRTVVLNYVVLGTKDTIRPSVLPMHVLMTGCPDRRELLHVRDSNDMVEEQDVRYYSSITTTPSGISIPKGDDPDFIHVPNPGFFEMDAYHFTDKSAFDQSHKTANSKAVDTTWGSYYWPIGQMSGTDPNVGTDATGKSVYHLVVHRLKVGGTEIVFNAPEVSSVGLTGDSLGGDPNLGAPNHINPHMRDFQPGDKVTISFSGVTRNLPFPQTGFKVVTRTGPSVDFSNASLYQGSVLDQVQVVPNPYIVTHMGQTSTDNAKLYFTRLPPRATIEIYALDGTLVNTLEHYGYAATTTPDPSNPAQLNTTYDFSTLGDRSSVQEWNLLTSGKQRVGSQVLIARIVAKDPNKGDAEVAETTKKFAIVVGISK